MEMTINIADVSPSFELESHYRRLLIYARIGVLAMLVFYEEEKGGLPYRDLKNALHLPDGSLGPNILWLRRHGYIRRGRATMYEITPEGKIAYNRIKEWLTLLMSGFDNKL